MATIADMGVEGAGAEILQPMLKNRFRVDFIGLGAGSTADLNALTIQAITVDRPKLSFEEITLDRYNVKAYIAGKYSFQTSNIVFESDIGGTVAAALQAQLEAQQNIIGMSPAPRFPAAQAGQDYKFSTVITQLDGDNTAFEIWYLEGCWIQNIDYAELDYAASETVKITTTLRYDNARQNIIGGVGKATGGIVVN